MFCRSHNRIQVKNIPKGANKRRKAKMCEGNKKRSPPTQPTWVGYQRERGLGLARNRPREGGRELALPGCERTRGAAAPLLWPPRLGFHRLMHGDMQWQFPMVS